MIIGITGTLGAGKTTCVSLLEKEGFVHYSVREKLIHHITERGMPVDRDSMVTVANELRATHGPAYLAQELFREAHEKGDHAVIESLRAPAEITALRELADEKNPFLMIAIDAPIETRYERITARKSETDMVPFDEFKKSEEKEMHSEDPTKQNLSACITQSDIRIVNDGSMEGLKGKLEDVIWGKK